MPLRSLDSSDYDSPLAAPHSAELSGQAPVFHHHASFSSAELCVIPPFFSRYYILGFSFLLFLGRASLTRPRCVFAAMYALLLWLPDFTAYMFFPSIYSCPLSPAALVCSFHTTQDNRLYLIGMVELTLLRVWGPPSVPMPWCSFFRSLDLLIFWKDINSAISTRRRRPCDLLPVSIYRSVQLTTSNSLGFRAFAI